MNMDIVIIGASVEGLVAASRLAATGRKVLVVERLNDPGGLMAGGLIGAGVRHVGFWPRADHLSPAVVSALQLDRHGLQQQDEVPVLAVGPDRAVRLSDAGAEAAGDGAGWRSHHAFLDRIAPLAREWLSEPPPAIAADAALMPLAKRAVQLRRLGRADMFELLRTGPSSLDDFLSESLTDPLLRAGLMVPALHGTWMGPRSPQSTAIYLLRRAMRAREVVGGPAALVRALVASCASTGVQIQCGAAVARIDVDKGRASGVTLADGTVVTAGVVLSSIGPKETLGRLVAPIQRIPREAAGIRTLRTRGTWAAVHIAISGDLTFRNSDGEPVSRAIVAASPMDVERCFDDIKYRRPLTSPVLDVTVASGTDHASAGSTVVSVSTFVGHEQDAGWDDAARKALMVRVLETLGAHSDLTSDRVKAVHVVSPTDCESVWGHDGGHPMHGELALDQLWALRPNRTLAAHKTATEGLWLASTGSGPGLMGTGLAGLHAADAIVAAGAR